MPQESLVCFSQFKKFKKPEGPDYSERPGQQLIVLVAVVTQINWVKYWKNGQGPLVWPLPVDPQAFVQEWIK